MIERSNEGVVAKKSAMNGQQLHVTVIQGSILEVDAQVIVNAANSHGVMGGGVAGVIRRAAGAEVEAEARQHAPIPVGQAVLTSGGLTRFQGIIHAPTMPEPAMRIPPENAALVTRAAIALADKRGFVSVAIPGMGTGVGGVSPTDTASRMLQQICAFLPKTLCSVTLVDVDPAMIQAWRETLSLSADD